MVDNNLSINYKKTVVMHFGLNVERVSYFINNFKLIVVSSFKDLGIFIDEKLKFGKHCSEVYKM